MHVNVGVFKTHEGAEEREGESEVGLGEERGAAFQLVRHASEQQLLFELTELPRRPHQNGD